MGVRLLPIFAAIVCNIIVSIIGSFVFLLITRVSGTNVSNATSFVTTMELKKHNDIRMAETDLLLLHLFKSEIANLSNTLNSSKALMASIRLNKLINTGKFRYSIFGDWNKLVPIAKTKEMVKIMSFLRKLRLNLILLLF